MATDADDELPGQLQLAGEPLLVLARDLQVVVEEADGAVADGDQQRQPDQRAAQVAPEDGGGDQRQDDERAAHRRRAALGGVRRRAVLADHLAELPLARAADEPGGDEEGDEQRGQRRHPDARRDVAEDVGPGTRSCCAADERGGTAWVSFPFRSLGPSATRSASTARSRRRPRDALTRIQSPARGPGRQHRGGRFGRRRDDGALRGEPGGARSADDDRRELADGGQPGQRRARPRGRAPCAPPRRPGRAPACRPGSRTDARRRRPPRARRAPRSSRPGWRCSSRRGCVRPPAATGAERCGGSVTASRPRRGVDRRDTRRRAPPPAPRRRCAALCAPPSGSRTTTGVAADGVADDGAARARRHEVEDPHVAARARRR